MIEENSDVAAERLLFKQFGIKKNTAKTLFPKTADNLSHDISMLYKSYERREKRKELLLHLLNLKI
jgi:hypothetical protein